MIGLFGTKDFGRDAGILEHGAEPLGLRRGIGMVGDMEDQERRNALVLRNVRDGREIAMLCRIAAEFFVMAELRVRLAMNAAPAAVSMIAGTS